VSVDQLSIRQEDLCTFSNISKYVTISDIHGQYELFTKFLQAQNIIDKNLEWIFDDGHFIVLGDIFNIGSQVTECLWLLYNLEKQAARHGGKVHILLGNHDLMALHGNLEFIHPKYEYISQISSLTYDQFFDNSSFLGNWLRSKNISIIINDVAFVHAGFSKEIIKREKSVHTLNQLFKNKIYSNPDIKFDTASLISQLYSEQGPLWYRGYADPSGIDLDEVDYVLENLEVSTVVVGHTSLPKIISLANNKVFLIDSSIKFGKSGELLIYNNGSFYRGYLSGDRLPLIGNDKASHSKSAFEYVYDINDLDITIVLDTDFKNLMRNKFEEEYQSARLDALHKGEFNRSWNVRIRTRGNTRKKVCHLPPIKIDFVKDDLEYMGFSKKDKLKLVLPCGDTDEYQEKLFTEELIYRLYQAIDSLSLRTKPVNIIIKDRGKIKYRLRGFMVEEEKEYCKRTGTNMVGRGIVSDQALHRESYLKMCFFQYMILNTDWAVTNQHNLEIIFVPGEQRPRAIPYDFDYAGMVDQEYAVPFESFPIEDVREPLFRGKDITEQEVELMRIYFNEKKDELIKITIDYPHLNDRNKKHVLNDIKRFYKTLETKKHWKKRFLFPRR
jgi:hypothetical protein